MPWFQAAEIPEQSQGQVREFSSSRPRIEITSRAELQRFAQEAKGSTAARTVLQLRPSADHVRDKTFVSDVVDVCVSTAASVELVGSSLAHPYYMLQRAGVPVVCVNDFEPASEAFNKLVRDRIPEMIEMGGEEVISVVVPEDGRSGLLRLKLVEEALEVLRAETIDESVSELADLQEVIASLRRSLGIPRELVRARMKSKRQSRGGFEEGRVLLRTRMTALEDNPQGMLPGFPADEGSTSRLWRVRSSAERLTINLLPPLPGERVEFEARLGVGVATVHYVRDGIEIRLASSRHALADQQTLFSISEMDVE